VAEGGGLLNRYTLVKAYRGFESLRLRHRLADQRLPMSVGVDANAEFLGISSDLCLYMSAKVA
jgi:hypothetical protein